MTIPLLDLKAQYDSIREDVNEVIKRVVESQYFILSEEVDSLEREVAEYTGAEEAAGVASGTDALVLALRAARIEKGDRVITSPFTFFATSEAVSLVGGVPVFADIDPDTYNLDAGKLEEAILNMPDAEREKLKAVIAVHIYGQCADMDSILKVADKYNLKVIEDCAQAIGAVYKGKKAGSFGLAGAFSFFPSKNLGGFGDGGMIVSNDSSIIDSVKKLRGHGSVEQYIHEEVGYNSRLDSLQAAILRVKLKKLDEWLAGRRRIAGKYDEAFEKLGIKTPKVAQDCVHTYHQYTIQLEERDEIIEFLKEKGISSRIYYPVPLHLQPCYKDLGYTEGSFPISENAVKKVVSLPVYPELTNEQVDYIIGSVEEFINRKP